MTNPFAQAQELTELSWELPEEQAAWLADGLEDLALASTCVVVDEAQRLWRLKVFADASQLAEIRTRLAILRAAYGVDIAHAAPVPVAARDWVAQVQASFRPIDAGRFFVHGSHIEQRPAPGRIPICIDAGAAFGTGEHETTTGCLLALDGLTRRRRFKRVLDMGCGSGILAIAAARLWPAARVEAVDIDPMSVRVATWNMAVNGVQRAVACRAGDGYRVARGHYDLIIANILARPLMYMAGELAAHLAPGGVAVLSGLLTRQERMVLWAHRCHGLMLRERIIGGGWATLVIGR